MGAAWVPVEEQRSFGFAKYFLDEKDLNHFKFGLKINFGDALFIKKEWGEWYYVTKVRTDEEGIVPKSYIHISDFLNGVIGESSQIKKDMIKMEIIFQEIDPVLRSWCNEAKRLFIQVKEDTFEDIRENIKNLLICRKKILIPNLTTNEFIEQKLQVANIVDTGNHMLGFDICVRDDEGNILNPLVESTIEIYKKHKEASKRLKGQKGRRNLGKIPKQIFHDSRSLLIENIKCRNYFDGCQLRCFLYDADEKKQISEYGIFTLKNAEWSLPSDLKFLFTGLGNYDVDLRKRIYLVIYVLQNGLKCGLYRCQEQISHSLRHDQKVCCFRPRGVAAKKVTDFLRFNSYPTKPDPVIEIPYIEFSNQESMVVLLDKILNFWDHSSKFCPFECSVSLISGNYSQIKEDNSESGILTGNPIEVRKMKLPLVIHSKDVRNELYLELIQGDFERSDGNIEVTVSFHDSAGNKIPGMIWSESGEPIQDSYISVVYNGVTPKWNEIIKITLPTTIEDFSRIHIRFTFKSLPMPFHWSSKVKPPFAMSFLKLHDSNGTAINDDFYNLAVYKIDPKLYNESNVNYLMNLTSMRSQMEESSGNKCTGYTYSSKDSFIVRTMMCSSIFTQNGILQELLEWSKKIKEIDKTEDLKRDEYIRKKLLDQLKCILNNFNAKKVRRNEIVKFLPDIFDALLGIFLNPFGFIRMDMKWNGKELIFDEIPMTGAWYKPVFDCLVFIFHCILDYKDKNVDSIFSLYLESGYTAAFIHLTLLREIQYLFERKNFLDEIPGVMKTIGYFFKFIIQSFNNRIALGKLENCNDMEELYDEFNKALHRLFSSMCAFLSKKQENYHNAQEAILRHIPDVIDSLCIVLPPRKCCEYMSQIIRHATRKELTLQKLETIKNIIQSSLFLQPVCRTYLLPIVVQNIRDVLPVHEKSIFNEDPVERNIKSIGKIKEMLGSQVDEFYQNTKKETVKCVKILKIIMHILHRNDIGPTTENINYIMLVLLLPLIKSIEIIGEDNPLAANMVVVILAIFRPMTSEHYTGFVKELKRKNELREFLDNILVLLNNLSSQPFFPADWTEMFYLQNSILITGMENFAVTLEKEFLTPFKEEFWAKFFKCSISFLTQGSWQIEKFSKYKSFSIISRYGDTRQKAGKLIKQMWFDLEEPNRMKFILPMIGAFLEMSLIPEPEVRGSSIEILFDMIRLAFIHKELFEDAQIELFKWLFQQVEGGKGDVEFHIEFHEKMKELCETDISGFRIPGLKILDSLSRLIGLLLEYRESLTEIDQPNHMSCIVNLMDFCKEFNQNELYIRYLYELHDIHVNMNNYAEAAFTLKLHIEYLEIILSSQMIPSHLKSPLYPEEDTQFDLKTEIYFNIISAFALERKWEFGLEILEKFENLYSDDFLVGKEINLIMLDFYQEITEPKNKPWEPEYYRVGFFGKGFPLSLQNKVFIYRGKPLERLADFSERMFERFPNAIRLKKLNPPSDKKKFSNNQYLQMNSVFPLIHTSEKSIQINISGYWTKKFYNINEIDRFTYSRPRMREPQDPKNECASLWLERYYLRTSRKFPGILSCLEVVHETVEEIPPIQVAIEEMNKSNSILRDLVIQHESNPQEPIGNLSLKLNGILDASVNGGVKMYENAFLTKEYLEQNPLDFEHVKMLKNLIIQQSPILKYVLNIHKQKCGEEFEGMQRKLEDSYALMNKRLEKAYGVNPESLKDEILIRDLASLRKVLTPPSDVNCATFNRNNSEPSFGDDKEKEKLESRMPNSSLAPSNMNIKEKKLKSKPSIFGRLFNCKPPEEMLKFYEDPDNEDPFPLTSSQMELEEVCQNMSPLETQQYASDRRSGASSAHFEPEFNEDGAILPTNNASEEIFLEEAGPPPLPPKNIKNKDNCQESEITFPPIAKPRIFPTKFEVSPSISSIINFKKFDYENLLTDDEMIRDPPPPPMKAQTPPRVEYVTLIGKYEDFNELLPDVPNKLDSSIRKSKSLSELHTTNLQRKKSTFNLKHWLFRKLTNKPSYDETFIYSEDSNGLYQKIEAINEKIKNEDGYDSEGGVLPPRHLLMRK